MTRFNGTACRIAPDSCARAFGLRRPWVFRYRRAPPSWRALEHASAVSQPPRLGRGSQDRARARPQSGPARARGESRGEARRARDPARQEDDGLDVQRPAAGPVAARASRRPRDRALQELAARRDDDPLARAARVERDGRRRPASRSRRSSPAESSATSSCSGTRARTGITRTSIRPCKSGADSTVRSSSRIRRIRRRSATTSC